MPSRDGAGRVSRVKASRGPGFARRVPELLELIDGEVLVASKPRPTSFGWLCSRDGAATAASARHRRLGGGVLQSLGRLGPRRSRLQPSRIRTGLTWTWMTERLVGRADAITVASRFSRARRFRRNVPAARAGHGGWDPSQLRSRPRRVPARGLGSSNGRDVSRDAARHKGVDDTDRPRSVRWGPESCWRLVGVDPARAARRAGPGFRTSRDRERFRLTMCRANLVAATSSPLPQRKQTRTRRGQGRRVLRRDGSRAPDVPPRSR